MTIEVFMDNYGIKKKETVISWIKKGYILGADFSANKVPDSARPPYTKARAKKVDAIYLSIVEATRRRLHVLPQIYKICPDEFNNYITQLENAGLIVRRVSDGITYYDLAVSATRLNKKFILDAIERCSKGIAEGVTTALLGHVNPK